MKHISWLSDSPGDPGIDLFGYSPHFFLFVFRKGEEGLLQLFLGQVIQHVGLVLAVGCRMLDGVSAVFKLYDIGIVTGCDIVGFDS